MNLEAGKDWFQRLWASMVRVRCVFVDLTELTSFVNVELKLASQVVGLDRIMFIVDSSKSRSEWEDEIRRRLVAIVHVSDPIQLAIWDPENTTSHKQFRESVRDFAKSLPLENKRVTAIHGAIGISNSEIALSNEEPYKEDMHDAKYWIVTSLLTLTFSIVATCVLHIGFSVGGDALMWWVRRVTFVVVFWYLIGYLIESGPRERLFATVSFCAAGLFLSTFLGAVEGAREAASRTQCRNQLKLITLACWEFQDIYRAFPPAYLVDQSGKPQHSWRVLILPYLGEHNLYMQYRFDEPWNSKHNLTLADKMPEVFRCPSDVDASEGQTSYFIVTGQTFEYTRKMQTPERALMSLDGFTQRPWMSVSNTECWGTSSPGPYFSDSTRVVVVESTAHRLNWLDPMDLTEEEFFKSYSPDFIDETGIFRSPHADCTNVGFTDCSVDWIPNSLTANEVKSWFDKTSLVILGRD